MDKNSVIALMEQLGFEKAKKSGLVCPFCDNGHGFDGTGIEPYESKKGNGKWYFHCFGADCPSETMGLKDILDWVIRKDGKENLSYPEKLDYVKESYNVDLCNYSFSSMDLKSPIEEKRKLNTVNNFNYLLSRGICQDVQRNFRIGYTQNYINNRGYNCGSYIAIPVGKFGSESYVMRATEKNAQNRVLNHGKIDVFNVKAFDKKDEIVIITEGAIDALSIEVIKYQNRYSDKVKPLKKCNAVSINGAGNYTLLDPYVNKCQKYIILMDWDEAGIKAGIKIKQHLDSLGVTNINAHDYICYPDHTLKNDYISNIPVETIKDVNDILLCGNLTRMLLNLIKQADKLKLEHEKHNVSNYLDFFKSIERQEDNKPINTGFTCLNDVLDGGIRDGLYIIGAVSSLGKTTFMLQLADNMARYKDVLFFSLEMSARELVSKSLSRYMYINNGEMAKTVNQLNDVSYWKYKATVSEKNILESAIKSYENDVSKYLNIYEGRIGNKRLGVKEIREIVKNYVDMKGRTPIVIVDYLQILAPGNIKATDKQNTDTAVFELKEISRDFNTPVFAISSFNRESYRGEVTMTSFKESGAIEYSSDILLGLQYDGLENYDQVKQKKEINAFLKKNSLQDTRKVQLKILKNRNGKKDISVNFDYIPKFNLFKDTGTDDKFLKNITSRKFEDMKFLD